MKTHLWMTDDVARGFNRPLERVKAPEKVVDKDAYVPMKDKPGFSINGHGQMSKQGVIPPESTPWWAGGVKGLPIISAQQRAEIIASLQPAEPGEDGFYTALVHPSREAELMDDGVSGLGMLLEAQKLLDAEKMSRLGMITGASRVDSAVYDAMVDAYKTGVGATRTVYGPELVRLDEDYERNLMESTGGRPWVRHVGYDPALPGSDDSFVAFVHSDPMVSMREELRRLAETGDQPDLLVKMEVGQLDAGFRFVQSPLLGYGQGAQACTVPADAPHAAPPIVPPLAIRGGDAVLADIKGSLGLTGHASAVSDAMCYALNSPFQQDKQARPDIEFNTLKGAVAANPGVETFSLKGRRWRAWAEPGPAARFVEEQCNAKMRQLVLETGAPLSQLRALKDGPEPGELFRDEMRKAISAPTAQVDRSESYEDLLLRLHRED